MMRDLDENGVGLYRASYVHDEYEQSIDSMLLPLGRKDKTKVKGIIAVLKNISSIDRAPNDTVFLGRCSLLKCVQSFED